MLSTYDAPREAKQQQQGNRVSAGNVDEVPQVELCRPCHAEDVCFAVSLGHRVKSTAHAVVGAFDAR